jgi:hypothetical protein
MRRLAATTLRRLAALEQQRSAAKPMGAWPPILSLDDWEKAAMASQEKLVADTREFLHVRPGDAVMLDGEPDDVSHKYKAHARMPGIEVRSVSR